MIFGFSFLIIYLNLFSFGFHFLDYFLFIISNYETLSFFLGFFLYAFLIKKRG